MKADKPNVNSGCVAIFWVDTESTSKRVYAVKSPLSQSEQYNGYLVHKSCHYDSWSAIQKQNPKWQGQYEDYPRGRCVFNLKTQKFIVYVCPVMKGNGQAIQEIVREFCLPKGKYFLDYSDEHYILPTF